MIFFNSLSWYFFTVCLGIMINQKSTSFRQHTHLLLLTQ